MNQLLETPSLETFAVSTNHLLALLLTLTTTYVLVRLVKLLFPPRRGIGIPRISWLQLFNLNKLALLPLDDIIKSIKRMSERAGYQIAEHPHDPAFYVWDVEFANYVINNPSLFPAYLIPDTEKWQNVLPSNFIVGDRNRWSAVYHASNPLTRLAWSPSKFHSATRRLIRRLEETKGAPIDALVIIERSVSEVIYEIIFGVEADDDFFEDGHEGSQLFYDIKLMLDFHAETNTWMMPSILDATYRQRKSKMNEAYDRLFAFVEKKKQALIGTIPAYAQIGNENELLPRLIEASAKGLLPPKSIVMDVLFFFAAGQAAVAAATHVTLYHLGKDQNLQQEVRMEIENNIGGSMPQTSADLQDLLLLKAALDETMRVAPPLEFTMGYEALEATPIGPKGIIPKGSVLNFVIGDIHRNPNYFENPNEYDPYRWLTKDRSKLATMKKAFMPYGFGRPICPGRYLSKAEALTMLAVIQQNFNIRLSDEANYGPGEEPFNKISSISADFSGLTLHFDKR